MNKNRILLFALTATGAVLSACNDSGNIPPEPEPVPQYPRTLTLGASEVAEFEVYVGSPEGAVLLENHNLTPEYFWKGRLESYPPKSLRFDDDNVISYPDTGWVPDTYRFVNDSLFRYLIHRDEWEWSGRCTKEKLYYHIGYRFHLVHREGGWILSAGLGQDNRWMKPEREFYDFPASMTDLRDTLAICNIVYTYESDADF